MQGEGHTRRLYFPVPRFIYQPLELNIKLTNTRQRTTHAKYRARIVGKAH